MASQSYIFGLTEIDAQHKAIEDLLGTLQAKIARDTPHGALLKSLDRLYTRLETHFAVEEAVLGLLSLPESNSHLAAHAEILRLIGVCQRSIETGGAASGELAEWVRTIIELIHAHDIGFVAYLGVLREFLARPCAEANAAMHEAGSFASRHRGRRHGNPAGRERRMVPAMSD